jgi:hypothetical protein
VPHPRDAWVAGRVRHRRGLGRRELESVRKGVEGEGEGEVGEVMGGLGEGVSEE